MEDDTFYCECRYPSDADGCGECHTCFKPIFGFVMEGGEEEGEPAV